MATEPKDVNLSAEAKKKYEKRVGPTSTRACKPRIGSAFKSHTGGALWGFCACGLIRGVMELPQAEATRMVVLFLIRLYGGG